MREPPQTLNGPNL